MGKEEQEPVFLLHFIWETEKKVLRGGHSSVDVATEFVHGYQCRQTNNGKGMVAYYNIWQKVTI